MTVIPDSIEPVEAWRSWNYTGTFLESLHYRHIGSWKPGEAHEAVCRGRQYKWKIVSHGWTLEQAQSQARSLNRSRRWSAMLEISLPMVEPPPGMGYQLVDEPHDAPDRACSCGIYAVKKRSQAPTAMIVGKVKLWGTIIPGTKGLRAQFAYPSELYVPSKYMNDPALLAYGVPIVENTNMGELYAAKALSASKSSRKPLCIAVAVNIAACLLNLALILQREVF
jgi:hypothetical protein